MPHQHKILLVEDDPFISQMYTTKFEHAGYAVGVATTGREALERLKQEKPDIVLLDVLIPELDGFAVLENMRQDAALQHIPAIMLTNLGQKEDIERGQRLGATAYVIKAHFTPQEVVDKVKAVLAKHVT